MLEFIQQSAISHDRYQVELKLDYELERDQKTHYRTSTYIFVPRSLGITVESYSKDMLYRDIKNYIRIKTPEMNLRDLRESDISPLRVVQQLLKQPSWYLDDNVNDRLVYELRLFGSMFKSSLREHLNLVNKGVKTTSTRSEAQPLVNNLLNEFYLRSVEICTDYRYLYTEFNLPYVNKDILLAYSLVDEYVSLLLEESAIELYKTLGEHYYEADQQQHLQRVSKIVLAETAHRIKYGYKSVLSVNDENETYAFRSSVIKKYISGVLHLSIEAQREGKGLEQFLMALAAGISMVFATAVAFYFQKVYGSFTFPAFVALVVGYMFKDRIKESGRVLFAGKLHSNIYDRRIHVKTLDGKYKLATLRERIVFMKESEIPPEVRHARQQDPFANLDNDRHGETIICHTKDIVLNAGIFQIAFSGSPKTSGLNDIIRYDIYPYLRKMDDPVEDQLFLDGEKLETVHIHKVYHINFVTKYTSFGPGEKILYKRMRLVLNRLGIKRIEYIDL